MNRHELHELLTQVFGLVPEPIANNVSCTYFYGAIDWHPQRSTRVVRVLFESNGEPSRIQLCASSDNNNTVLIAHPFEKQVLIAAVLDEIALIEAQQQVSLSYLTDSSNRLSSCSEC